MSHRNIAFAIIALIALIACATVSFAQEEYPGGAPDDHLKMEVKILSYNLRHNKDFWEERFPMIAEEIVRLNPDVIGLQEVLLSIDQSTSLKNMIKERGGADYEYYERLKTGVEGMSGEGVAIFSRHPIVKKADVDLKYGRPGVMAIIDLGHGFMIDMANTHLHNEGGDSVRGGQAEKLLKFIDSKKSPNPVFLTGDMNSTPGEAAITSIVADGFVDSYLEFHGLEKTTAEGSTSPIKLSKDNPVQNIRNRIDYVFYRQGGERAPRVKVLDSAVVLNAPRADGMYPSDHLGVMTTFELSIPVRE